MEYKSTRGGISNVSFEFAVRAGLAPDGGLFVPQNGIPRFSNQKLKNMRESSFSELALNVMSEFVGEKEIPRQDLKKLIERTYATNKSFRDPKITPVVSLDSTTQPKIMELFHGPTYAFKDVALQFLGNLFEYFLQRDSKSNSITILGATSGDTGSASIAGLLGKKGVTTFILFPEGKVSPIQERQMTTLAANDESVHCLSVQGTFDDAQAIVKDLFVDKEFQADFQLGAVNSINFARILAQIVYYFSAYYQVTKSNDEVVNFVVPTGNFGDILAGFYAKLMGLPIGKLVVATNSNDILHRFFESGKYHREDCKPTISPSMDICISSNFERFLLWVADDDTDKVMKWMNGVKQNGKLTLDQSGDLLKKARSVMGSANASEQEILTCIRETEDKYGYILCPHSAIGLVAYRKLADSVLANGTTVCLATAHHAKFPDAVRKAVGPDVKVPIEPALEKLKTLPQEKHIIPATSKAVKSKMYSIMVKPDEASPRHSKTRTTNKKKLMKRKNTPHPVKGILKRKHLARTESSYAYALRSMGNLFTQHDKEVANDLKTLKIVAGSLLAGAAVGLGVYYYSKRRR